MSYITFDNRIENINMTIDKSWIFENDRFSDRYWNGAMAFLERAKNYMNEDGFVSCPCINCLNVTMQTLPVVEAHIIDKGFSRT